jgi:GntR family transcriptional regulator
LYLQVRDLLMERIARREWRSGQAVPNEIDLAREYQVSPGTVRKALELMEAEQLITRRQGKGTFVSDHSSNAAARFGRIRGPGGEAIGRPAAMTAISEGSANERECMRLRLNTGDAVYRLRRLWRDGHRTVLLEDVALPAGLYPGLRENKDLDGGVGTLARDYGVLLGRAEERILLGTAPPDVANILETAVETPLMVLDRVIFMLDGRPVEWRVAYCDLPGGYYLAEMK